ncbi:hypothetical protein NLB33_27025 [Mycolicibacterium smegmatis]|uniref:hypothetical protein n=1 Tax=Mycolicibacterium smegmatis TaxID=1772 RepID=UPI0020A27F95|nr:hypothetical protein [Mycolicibacterium smegmatis]MCP2626501.1 hypothetical protein [Mycolicibacterium smegmatis]
MTSQDTADEDWMEALGQANLEDLFRPPEPEPGTLFSSAPNESPLIMGTDGDDVGRRTKVKMRVDGNGDPERTRAELAPIDLMEANQGFLIRTIEAPKTTWRTTCEICERPLPLTKAGSWVCELGSRPGSPAWDQCRCNWCLIRGQWMRGAYRANGGQPRKRCDLPDCNRIGAKLRKRKSRGTKVPEGLLPEVPGRKRHYLRKSAEGGGRW